MTSGERFGLLNQSTFDDTMITEEQPSFIESAEKPAASNTGKWTKSDLLQSNDPKMAFDNGKKEDKYLDVPDPKKDDDMSFASKNSIENMSAAQIEVFSAQMNREQYYALGAYHSYACFLMLILISITNTMQRAAISYMFSYQSMDQEKYEDPHYNIRADIPDMTNENFNHIAGDSFTIFYAFMVLLTGAASDLFNRKALLLGSCFMWCMTTYLSSFAMTFNHLYILRIIMAIFNAASGPCSYSLITDWIPPENRVMAYSVYALGVQAGGPFSSFNTPILEWLGWRATFQYLSLMGFIVLALSIVLFDEPERGRFDIAQSVVVNPDQSMKSGSMAYGYQLSEQATRKRLDIQAMDEDQSSKLKHVKNHFQALKELFVNDTANWILLGACLRTQQGVAMGLFTQQYFLIYDRMYEFDTLSSVSGLIGSFICTMGTAIICDRYDNYNYMTKAYICIFTTMISIPCCMMIYLCNNYFWISMTGLFIEYLLSTGWGQPAIGILSTVCDPSVRGTAVSVFFFLITIFGVVAPMGYQAIFNTYGLNPYEEPREFGQMVAACTIIPCVLAIPCFYIAGVKYSWYKYHEAMFMLDVWGEMEQWYQDDISKKRLYAAQMNGEQGDTGNLSVSVDWKILKEQRKMKIKEFKNDKIQLDQVKPMMKSRTSLMDKHAVDDNGEFGLQKKKTIVANLEGDDTISEFPDTRSFNDNENSFKFQKYSQSFDARDSLLNRN